MPRIVNQRVNDESFEDEDVAQGSYEPFDIIVQREGGWRNAANIKATEAYARHCLTLGGKWVQRNPRTKRQEFLYLKMGVKQTFKKRWAVLRVESSEQKQIDKPAEKNDDVTTTAKAQAKPGAKGKSKSDGSDGTPPTKRQKTLVDEAFAKASATKTMYQTSTNQFNEIARSIANNKSWEWAKESGIASNMEEAAAKVTNHVNQLAVASDFFTGESRAKLKRRYDEAFLMVELTNLSTTLDPLVATLSQECGMLLAMHESRVRNRG